MPTPMKSPRAAPVSSIVLDDHLLDQADDAVRDPVRARLGARRNRPHGVVMLAVGGHRADDDVRAAQIDADDVLPPLFRGHGGGLKREVVER